MAVSEGSPSDVTDQFLVKKMRPGRTNSAGRIFGNPGTEFPEKSPISKNHSFGGALGLIPMGAGGVSYSSRRRVRKRNVRTQDSTGRV